MMLLASYHQIIGIGRGSSSAKSLILIMIILFCVAGPLSLSPYCCQTTLVVEAFLINDRLKIWKNQQHWERHHRSRRPSSSPDNTSFEKKLSIESSSIRIKRKSSTLSLSTIDAETTQTSTPNPRIIAILGGDLAGVIAALSAAEELNKYSARDDNGIDSNGVQIWLLTGMSNIQPYQLSSQQLPSKSNTENAGSPDGDLTTTYLASVLLPDSTWNSKVRQQLIPKFVKGGRELAGLLSSDEFSPYGIQQWLEQSFGVTLQDISTAGDVPILSNDRPLAVNSVEKELFGRQMLSDDGITMVTNVNITRVEHNPKINKYNVVWNDEDNVQQEFTTAPVGTSELTVDAIVLAGDPPMQYDGAIMPIADNVPHQANWQNKQSKRKKKQQLEDWMLDKPLSEKEKFKSKKKLKQALRKGKITPPIQESGDTETSSNADAPDSILEIIEEEKEDQQHQTLISCRIINALDIAENLGHSTKDYIPGMFNFVVRNQGNNSENSKKASQYELVPKARIRCKLATPPSSKKTRKKGRLPKVEGTIIFSKQQPRHTKTRKKGNMNEADTDNGIIMSGPAVWQLSSLIAHEFNDHIVSKQDQDDVPSNQGSVVGDAATTLHIHFAPDIGNAELVEEALENQADPNHIVHGSQFPLKHIEIDYDGDYDMETGTFPTVSYPLIPDEIWKMICHRAGIKSSSTTKWKDLSPKQRQNLVKLVVDFPLPISGIQPFLATGGIPLNEISMKTMMTSQRIRKSRGSNDFDNTSTDGGFYLCGSVLEIHSTNIGCHRLLLVV